MSVTHPSFFAGSIVSSCWETGSAMYPDNNTDVADDWLDSFFVGLVICHDSDSHGYLMTLVLPFGPGRPGWVYTESLSFLVSKGRKVMA